MGNIYATPESDLNIPTYTATVGGSVEDAIAGNMSPWTALETSRRAITHVWFRMWGLLWIVMLVYLLGFFTLTISWIWTMPWSVLAISMVYIKLFGAEPQTLAD